MISDIQPPATPIMLYIGAGYDLSPLLTFAPGGSPYPIVPLEPQRECNTTTLHPVETYTSFIFVDAKPRHTSAFMVPDFEQWKRVDARVRSAIQLMSRCPDGMLTRWRTVPGAPDLIWFEGGGDSASRENNDQWTTVTVQPPSSSSSPRPLTTLLYLFNTLDVEITRAPLMGSMWPKVEALYVHGLRIHPHTGAGMPSISPRAGALGIGLKRCYVLVGSWGGKTGISKVDFVKNARKRRRRLRLTSPSSSSTSSSALISPSTLLSTTDISCSTRSPSYSASSHSSSSSIPSLEFSTTASPASSTTSLSLIPSLGFNPSPTSKAYSLNPDAFSETELDYDSDTSFDVNATIDDTDMAKSSRRATYTPFHIPIPQISYSHALQRYHIARTIPECIALLKVRCCGDIFNECRGGDDGDSDVVAAGNGTKRKPQQTHQMCNGWVEKWKREEGMTRNIIKWISVGLFRKRSSAKAKEVRSRTTTDTTIIATDTTTRPWSMVAAADMNAESTFHRIENNLNLTVIL